MRQSFFSEMGQDSGRTTTRKTASGGDLDLSTRRRSSEFDFMGVASEPSSRM